MSDGVKTLCIVLLIPFLLAAGHDIYTNYFSDQEKIEKVEKLDIEPEKFQFSDVGYLWVTYAPNSHDAARESIDEASWKSFIEPVLRTPTMIVAAAPAAVVYGLLLILWVFGLPPFQRIKKAKGPADFDVYNRHGNKQMKYKRK